ncbi:MAG: hypothetical protein DMF67_08355 [Acidobacteria bacterium]|nr:MAG: hypothetical protein DMF67_08355 [Acidobacteriota bacterium]
MSEVANVLDELRWIHEGDAWHGAALKESLSGVTAEQAAARPVAGAHSIWELIRHITAWENVFRLRLEGQPATEPEEGDFPPVEDISEEAWAEALRRLDGGHERLLQTVARLEDSVLPEKVPGKDYSTRFLLHGVVRHHVYHAGQIALLKKSFAP